MRRRRALRAIGRFGPPIVLLLVAAGVIVAGAIVAANAIGDFIAGIQGASVR